MEQYFWEVSITGWATVAIAYAIVKEGERKAAAQRRAQVAATTAAIRGAGESMAAIAPAMRKAAASMNRFGEQLREAAYRANQPKGPAPKRRRG